MKRGLFIFTFISMLNFASAQGLSDILNQIDMSSLILYSVFTISFLLLFFSMNKIVLKDDKMMSGIISVILAFLLTYWANKSNFDIEGLFYNFGISESNLSLILSLIIIAGIVYTIIKFKKNSLLILGGLLIFASFFVYAKTILITIAVILIVIRIFIQGGNKNGESPKWKKAWKKYLKKQKK